MMVKTGLLVGEWPLTLGADGCGIVVEAGANAGKSGFKVGDYVCGTMMVGYPGHGVAQELHLRQAAVTIRKPSNLTAEEGATIGAGYQTAALGIDQGLKVDIPDHRAPKSGEWALVMGGAGNVGRAAVQVLLLAGYNVVTTCSARSKQDLESLGATTVDYKQPEADQIKQILDITGGQCGRIYDATSADDPVIPKAIFKNTKGDKFFTTTNSWSGITDFEGGKTHEINIGPLGRPEATELNEAGRKYSPIIVKLVEDGLYKIPSYEVAGEGYEGVLQAYEYHGGGQKSNKRILVKIQDE